MGGSLGIGIIGGLVYSLSSCLLKKLRIDDPLDAFSVHGACGIWGVVAVGFFGVHEYICSNPSSKCITMAGQTAMQIVGVLCIIAWTTVTSVLLFGLLKIGNMLRVSEEVEIHGLDMDHHLGYTGILRYAEEVQNTKLDVDIGDDEHQVYSVTDTEEKLPEGDTSEPEVVKAEASVSESEEYKPDE